jgi:ribosome-binding protein aMBF1 (putative translation factor)
MSSLAVLKTAQKSTTSREENIFRAGASLLTGRQIKMARAAVGWTAEELAARTGLGVSAIQRAENTEGMPDMRTRNLAAIKTTLERAGVVFIDGPIQGVPGTGVGVRLRK